MLLIAIFDKTDGHKDTETKRESRLLERLTTFDCADVIKVVV